MIPLRDENPTLHPPVATVTIIIACVVVWILFEGLGTPQALVRSLCLHGLIPGRILGLLPPGTQVQVGRNMYCVLQGSSGLHTIFAHMFLHGSWFHLIGNMWFLWVFGDNVEDAMGSGRFFVFYLICGLAAASLQIATHPSSALPMVGASGAIGGVMGAYARFYPHARVHVLIFLGFFMTTVSVPAVLMLGYWFLLQLLGGIPALASAGGGIAFWAHIGGFASGYFLADLFRRR